MVSDNEIEFYGDLSPSLTKSCFELEYENYISSSWFDNEEEMMGSNVAAAAEEQSALKPFQKPDPKAEPKVISSDKTTERDAPSSDHPNDIYEHLPPLHTKGWEGEWWEDYGSSLFFDEHEEMMGCNVAAAAAEEKSALKPLQKPDPEAEPKMIPSQKTTDQKEASSSGHQNDFYGHLQPSLTNSWLDCKWGENNDSSLFFDKQKKMMGCNVAAAEEQSALKPLQKPDPQAEPKMIPFQKTTDQKDASSSGHQNDFYGPLQPSLTNSRLDWKWGEDNDSPLFFDKQEEMMGCNVAAVAVEELSTLKPLQKPDPQAEPKMIPFQKTIDQKDASSSGHQNDFYGHLQPSLTNSWLDWKWGEDNDSSLFFDKQEEMMGCNVAAAAAEEQSALKPLQKPDPQAEPKMIPFQKTTYQKDASSSYHQNDFYGHLQPSLTNSWLDWKWGEDNDSSLFFDKQKEMMGCNVAAAAEEQSALKPLQKPDPEAEAKMIPFDKTKEKDASSPDHPNYPDGWIMKKDDGQPSWLPPEWDFVKKTCQSGGSKDHVDKKEMMGCNVAAAAEEQSALMPLQKPDPEAEAKMIPLDKTKEKDASSPDHPNYPDGWIMKKDDGRPSWLPPEWNFVKKTRQSGGSKGHVDKYYISPAGHVCRSKQDFLKFRPSNSNDRNSKKRKLLKGSSSSPGVNIPHGG